VNKATKIIVVLVAVVGVAILLYFAFRPPATPGPEREGAAPVFSLAWSEYPSWSTYGVADLVGLIDGKRGRMGPIEKKWGVDIELKEADYDTCILMYGSNQCDAACLTNMDALNPSLSRPTVGILPNSTSFGADACIVGEGIKTVKDLRGKNVYGLKKTVSEYCFVRCLEILGENEKDHNFTNMDPGAAALAFQQKKPEYQAIMVWNPFTVEALSKRPDSKRLFDSTSIPGEIVDMVVMGQASLNKPGGEAFACAVIDTYYAINRRLADPKTRADTLRALAEKFAKIDMDAMEQCVTQTRFYATAEEGVKLYTGDEFKAVNERVLKFCVTHEIVSKPPTIGYGDKQAAPDVTLRIDPTYIRQVQARLKAE
jgi:NitT/TauT family transport system substrate-binding protein